MFTFTKREKENQNINKFQSQERQIKTIPDLNKTIFSCLRSPKLRTEVKSDEKNIVNIEHFLRYSQKFRNLKAMQLDLEKLLSKNSFEN